MKPLLGGFNIAFGGMLIFSAIISILAIAVFVIVFAKIIGQWNKNNNSPKLTVPATVVSKRTAYSHHSRPDHYMHHSTTYYITFEVGSGDRMEFVVPGNQFGLIIEGDTGNLSFQGTRFLGFFRT